MKCFYNIYLTQSLGIVQQSHDLLLHIKWCILLPKFFYISEAAGSSTVISTKAGELSTSSIQEADVLGTGSIPEPGGPSDGSTVAPQHHLQPSTHEDSETQPQQLSHRIPANINMYEILSIVHQGTSITLYQQTENSVIMKLY